MAKSKNKQFKRSRVRTVMLALQIHKPRLFHWNSTKHDKSHSDGELIQLIKRFKSSSAYSDTDYSAFRLATAKYVLGNVYPRRHWLTKKQIFKSKRSNDSLFKAIAYHLITRLLFFYGFDSLETQEVQQKNLPKNKRHIKVPKDDMPHIAMILHDRDKNLEANQSVSLVKPHAQISIHFNKPVTIKQISKWLGVAQSDVQKGKQDAHAEENAMAYLTHIKQPYNKNNYLPKHHYDWHKVIYDDPWFDYKALRKRCLHNWNAYRGKQIKSYCDMSLAELNNRVIRGELNLDDIYRNDKLFKVYCSKFKGDTDKIAQAVKTRYRSIHKSNFENDWNNGRMHRSVIYVYGQGGAGKSYIAKNGGKLAIKQHNRASKYSWKYQTLSGKKGTLFQNYNGSDVNVLDDVRKNNMNFDGYLAACDQIQQRKLFGSSEFMARGMIITTPHSPAKFFTEIGGQKSEDKSQAMRRLDLVIRAVVVKDADGNTVMENGHPKRMAEIYQVRYLSKPYWYKTGKASGFKSNYVLYPNPHLNYHLKKFALVTPKQAIHIIANRINNDNDPKKDHRGNDRPAVSREDYTKPTKSEQARITVGVKKNDPVAVSVQNDLNEYAKNHGNHAGKLNQAEEKANFGGLGNYVNGNKKLSVNDSNLPF